MTDEEILANESWFNEDSGYRITHDECTYVYAFNKGLKASRPQWHKVADGDLPKEHLRPKTLGYYLTASKHSSYDGCIFEVAYFTGVIFIKGGDILDNVIAWKEIVPPKDRINDK